MWFVIICIIIFAFFRIPTLLSSEQINEKLDLEAKKAGFSGFHPTIELTYGIVIDEQNKLFSYIDNNGKFRVSSLSLSNFHSVYVYGFKLKNKTVGFDVRDEVFRCERGGFELEGEIYLTASYYDYLGHFHQFEVKFTGLSGAKKALDYKKRINSLIDRDSVRNSR